MVPKDWQKIFMAENNFFSIIQGVEFMVPKDWQQQEAVFPGGAEFTKKKIQSFIYINFFDPYIMFFNHFAGGRV